MPVEVNWNAIGAIGQWAGSIATFAAVVISLKVATRTTRPRMKIIAQEQYAVPDSARDLRHGRRILFISAVNIGLVPIFLRSTNLSFPKGGWVIPVKRDQVFPRRLDPGESLEYDVNPYELAKTLTTRYCSEVLVYVHFQNATGKYHRTKFWFNPYMYVPQSGIQPNVVHIKSIIPTRYLLHRMSSQFKYVLRNRKLLVRRLLGKRNPSHPHVEVTTVADTTPANNPHH